MKTVVRTCYWLWCFWRAVSRHPLRRMQYIKGTREMGLVLGADDIRLMYTFVDTAFAVQNDMTSHTGGVVFFGRGGIACKFSKQKLVTKSSSEAELVGASDYLPTTIWIQNFLGAQGFEHQSSFEQDNQSTIRLERNGRASSGQRSRHINIRYFFIAD